jgi:hypothetical protein
MLVRARPRTLWGGPEFSEGLTDTGPDARGRCVQRRSVHPAVEAFDPDPFDPYPRVLPREIGAFGDGADLE